MSQSPSPKPQEGDERLAALYSNATAVRAIASAVEGTIGPKGLDTMLVDTQGHVVITNDGVTILNRMEVTHPAAKMLINVASAQQEEIGDGTTTATLLAAALLNEGVAQVERGVPVTRVIEGITSGVSYAVERLQSRARSLEGLGEDVLYQVAMVAGREHEDIAQLVTEAAQLIGYDKLRDPQYRLSDHVMSSVGAGSEVFQGLILNKQRMSPQMPDRVEEAKILLIDDALEPEEIDSEALGTEAGFQLYRQYKEDFRKNVDALVTLGINVVCTDRGVSPVAEEVLGEAGVMIVQRVASKDLRKIAEHTGARPIKRTGIAKSAEELHRFLGWAEAVFEDERMETIRIVGGYGKSLATILVGASTEEVVGERSRIARDAASSVQAAVRGGVVPGGGSVELWTAREVEKMRETVRGMTGFGVEAVARALRKPMTQIVQNAGFNPLEKVEEANVAQIEQASDTLAINCEDGSVCDMAEYGIYDPTPVKLHALRAAGEVTVAIMRIHTIIRMKDRTDEEE
ncbi:TCP-1/cpn60 chaperonin family protein [Tumebacillus permanentifrigoris]|uniref:Chaperonin GroEL (HSP60 family) n=1 Tax=Tumebacillus permanentifrigoris TaxID=378543 RepID=A0A316D5A9_9BACL|nr:TCP-1/cpn60 chaperonin family protein [Tumebacillus permanentifrigoris]PWK08390.1 chaperonin GroEL (HSP60 family) [Tumebacillus permanentifrigoris]